MNGEKRKLGCIADDFTGAGDLASFLAKGGMRTVLYCGELNESETVGDAQAVVIPLKIRTEKKNTAISEALKAAAFLKKIGCTQFYIKYCSTFDSTPQGNIGPVVDAVMEYLQESCTILCPALPVNGRTVKDGTLYVNGIPLAKSSMRNHPLTPMWASRISELMKDQGKYACMNIPASFYKMEQEKVLEHIRSAMKNQNSYYLVPDFYREEHAKAIIRIFGAFKLLTGGSGIGEELARTYGKLIENKKNSAPETEGRAVLVAGSVSETTLAQIRHYKNLGKNFYKIDPQKLWYGEITAEDICKSIQEKEEVLIYCTEGWEERKASEKFGSERFAALLENTLAQVVCRSVKDGAKRIISAGGETSGAVIKALAYQTYLISESIAPGVPVMIPSERPDVRIVLKSGNFGQEDFFAKALCMTKVNKNGEEK
ncbi:MAG: four-carbon acid sugar kinase family protein [Eubacteriales bacterium]|nr:four-carbon acid sugar kinase family protein [Eubacteriales bacterium]